MNDNQNNNDRPADQIRIGDAERNEAVRLLGEHYEAGRLSQEEHSERVDTALRSTTRKDLDALFTDLPREADPGWQGPGRHEQPAAGPQSGPQQGWPGWFAGPGQQGAQGRQGQQDQQGRPAGGRYASGGPFGGPPWARGGWRGPRAFGLPIPLIAILAVAALAGIACAVAGGHPPVLLFAIIAITTFMILRRRRFGPRGA
jgi:DUF1707 SHOCT-like domain